MKRPLPPPLARIILLCAVMLGGACVDEPTTPRSARPPEGPALALGISRTWTGAVSTSWHNAGNWSPSGVPAAQDTVTVPTGVPRYPVLSANASIGGVTVANGATLNLGVFDLTASANVQAGTTGGIIGAPGRLFLAGTAGTVRGNLPLLRVTGTYSLSGEVLSVGGRVVLAGGRLRHTGFRVRIAPP